MTIDLFIRSDKDEALSGIMAKGVHGRRARVAGTAGIEVWEIISNYLSLDKDFNRLKKAYHWLTPDQLRAVLGYYSAYPEEIEGLMDQNRNWTSQKIKKHHPLMTPIR